MNRTERLEMWKAKEEAKAWKAQAEKNWKNLQNARAANKELEAQLAEFERRQSLGHF